MQLNFKDKNLATFYHIGGLCTEGQDALAALAPRLEPHLPSVADEFYRLLQEDPQTAPYIEGRIDALKSTHTAWMRDIISGMYDDAFISRQEKIGEVHVKARISPHFVAASMSHLRAALPLLIHNVEPDSARAGQAIKSLMQVLDLCHYLIDRKYNETLMDNLGISPVLLNRLQTLR
jgi:truncated hemoglobin YjbI